VLKALTTANAAGARAAAASWHQCVGASTALLCEFVGFVVIQHVM
jgi:hypothetical protein